MQEAFGFFPLDKLDELAGLFTDKQNFALCI